MIITIIILSIGEVIYVFENNKNVKIFVFLCVMINFIDHFQQIRAKIWDKMLKSVMVEPPHIDDINNVDNNEKKMNENESVFVNENISVNNMNNHNVDFCVSRSECDYINIL